MELTIEDLITDCRAKLGYGNLGNIAVELIREAYRLGRIKGVRELESSLLKKLRKYDG